MFLYLSKLLPVFVYPLGLSCLLLGAALVLGLFRSRAGTARTCLILGLAVLWVFSTPWMAGRLHRVLQQGLAPTPVARLPEADCAILLGGALGRTFPGMDLPNLVDSSDRVLMAAALYRAGKVSRIIVAAGNLPWLSGGNEPPEAVRIQALLELWGVPREAVILDPGSRNTRENALNARRLMEEHGLDTALLVTSASHMRRAMAVFRRAGFPHLRPAAVDFILPAADHGPLPSWFPRAGALRSSTRALKEFLGLAVYRLRGWI